jgi:hypothetical protein
MVGELSDPDYQGILPRIARTLFSRVQTAKTTTLFNIYVSMMEIYMEKVLDLLDSKVKPDMKVVGDEK